MGKLKGCGRVECGVSTGICGMLTFGTGELSYNGYWQYPCEVCRDDWVERFGTINTESEEFREAMIKASESSMNQTREEFEESIEKAQKIVEWVSTVEAKNAEDQ